ncbi:MAG: divalent-cation tolerance protein CutA [bacterium]|nr:divalent-cation tolerance protein CutA [bacterium]MBU1918142.1 divalent-cation tolerance protein CutA [bacterium]
MQTFLVYITTPTPEEAKKIAKVLVDERLAAGVNVLPGVSSVYWWEGKVNEESELILLAQTKESCVEDLIERVKEIHSYTCPCVVAVPIEKGYKNFLEWIERETQ